MGRVAIGVEYDGAAYHGWQRQPHSTSVQETLQAALSQVADAPVELTCAGRTDAGVHARAQVAHFDTEADRSPRAWLLGVNSLLPASVNLRWVQPVTDQFHARYGALRRGYRYLVSIGTRARRWRPGGALVVYAPLDASLMQTAANDLVGEHDFSAFRAAECQARSPVRTIETLAVRRRGDWLSIDVTANAFLQHMVRNIVGTLLTVGRGAAGPQRARENSIPPAQHRGGHRRGSRPVSVAGDYAPEFGLPADSAMIDPSVASEAQWL